jgi:GNAT superfamily N-acetyltransferase
MRIVVVSTAEILIHRAKFSYDSARLPDRCALPGDDHPDSVHLVAFDGGIAVGAATLTFDPFELTDGELVLWRLRALGVDPAHRRNGIGLTLNTRRLWLVAQRGGEAAWCSARSENGERFARWGGELLGSFDVADSQAPAGTTHMLIRWDVGLLRDRLRADHGIDAE